MLSEFDFLLKRFNPKSARHEKKIEMLFGAFLPREQQKNLLRIFEGIIRFRCLFLHLCRRFCFNIIAGNVRGGVAVARGMEAV